MEFCPLHVFEKILCALHEDNPLERRVFAHDSAAAVSSYDELTQSNIFLQLNKFYLNLQPLYIRNPFCSANKMSHSFNFNDNLKTIMRTIELKPSHFLMNMPRQLVKMILMNLMKLK